MPRELYDRRVMKTYYLMLRVGRARDFALLAAIVRFTHTRSVRRIYRRPQGLLSLSPPSDEFYRSTPLPGVSRRIIDFDNRRGSSLGGGIKDSSQVTRTTILAVVHFVSADCSPPFAHLPPIN